jgi:hypothetical protein
MTWPVVAIIVAGMGALVAIWYGIPESDSESRSAILVVLNVVVTGCLAWFTSKKIDRSRRQAQEEDADTVEDEEAR